MEIDEAAPLSYGYDKDSESSSKHEMSSNLLWPGSDFFHHDLLVNDSLVDLSEVGETKAFFFNVTDLKNGGPLQKAHLQMRDKPNYNDQLLGEYISWLLGRCSEFDVEVHVDLEDNLPKSLIPFGTSSKYRPDVTVGRRISGNFVPTLYCEVQSSPISQSVCKNVSNLISLLRLLRHLSTEVTCLSGFTIPNADEKKKCGVETTVFWKDFRFHFTTVDISRTQLRDKICAEFQRVNKLLPSTCKSFTFPFFVPLSQSECSSFGEKDEVATVPCQVRSRFNIIVRTSTHLWKYRVNQSASFGFLTTAVAKSGKPPTLFSMYQKRNDNGFERYAILKRPLSIANAILCCKELIRGVAAALDELHSYGYSHLDVRLPNVCFNSSYQPVLIDLDRTEPIGKVTTSLYDRYDQSYMYEGVDHNSTCKKLDYKQLGLMALRIVKGIDCHRPSDLSKVIGTDKFFQELVNNGDYKEDLLEGSAILSNCNQPLSEFVK